MTQRPGGVSNRLLLTLSLGTVLNPLNSSMIAVALVSLQRDFGVSIATSTWLASGFYVVAAVCQPLMGRLADQLGARRLFIGGLVLMAAASALAPLAPDFGWLLVVRLVQAAATSTAYPSALILVRSAGGEGAGPPARALAVLSVAASGSAALGPVLGGLLVAVAGWEAVFLVNVPVTLAGIVLAVRVLAGVPVERGPRIGLRELDLPGIALFSGALVALIFGVLSLADRPLWWLAPVVVALGVLLVWRERSVAEPFLDVRGLVANRALRSVLAQQGGINLVFYCIFFGMPIWLEQVRGFDPATVGLLVLPTTLLSMLVTPVTARAIRRHGSTGPRLLGLGLLVVAASALQLLGDDTSVMLLLGIAVLLGVPNGVTNLSLQTALYAAAPAGRMGASAGLFQTFRYLGAIAATSVLGVILEQNLSTGGLHDVGLLITGVAVVLFVLGLLAARRR
ncbi:MFS transporter [Jiangella sp. DSM 45060]|uniref:MFS transporter n=1 Tax=Jiangella sp. DSM 45060 TaxID=1798224 RepID=UPI00087B66CB|nr:MFS transporter [Jiangella sp. DSM 45060]SDT67770.1 Predicted arabinose efflux permease, MFS family [Jiangella sp. DSM 45060]